MAGYVLNQMAGEKDVLKVSPTSFGLKGQDDYRQSVKRQELKSNYLVVSSKQISYWNSMSFAASAEMKVTWELIRPSSSSDSSNKWADITTIVAIVLVSFICCLCCALIFLRLMQITRRRRIYMDPDNPRLNAQHRNESSRRVYDRLTSSRVSIAAIETMLPVMQFSKNLVEVGEDICTVCFETYVLPRLVPGCSVRKLACKHVFHEICLLNWLRARAEPLCPNCKFNPFAELPGESSINGSGEMQVSEVIPAPINSQ